MRKRTQRVITCGLSLVLTVAGIVCCASIRKTNTDLPIELIVEDTILIDRMLSVEETIGLMFHGGDRPNGLWHLYSRANPAAKPELYRILCDRSPGLTTFYENATHILAYIGDDEDVKRMVCVMDILEGVLNGGEQDKIVATVTSLGIMARNGNANAASILNEMNSTEYWLKKGVKWRPEELVTSGHLTAELEGIAIVIEALTIAQADGVDELRRDVVNSIKDPQRRTLMSYRVDPSEMLGRANRIREAEKELPSIKDIETLHVLYDERESRLESFQKWVPRQYLMKNVNNRK